MKRLTLAALLLLTACSPTGCDTDPATPEKVDPPAPETIPTEPAPAPGETVPAPMPEPVPETPPAPEPVSWPHDPSGTLPSGSGSGGD